MDECKIKNLIFEHLCGEKRIDGFDVSFGGYFRKHIYSELKIEPYGRADIVSFNKFDKKKSYEIEIFEIKKNKINESSILQIYRYKAGIKEYLKKYDPNREVFFKLHVIGSGIKQNSNVMFMPLGTEEISFYEYKNINNKDISIDMISYSRKVRNRECDLRYILKDMKGDI